MSEVLYKEFQYKEKTIPYTIRKSIRARRIRLTIHYDGRVVLTLPPRGTLSGADRFIREKRDWLFKNFSEHERKTPNHPRTKYDFILHKNTALDFVNEKLKHFNEVYKFRYNSVRVKDLKSQWGSCSTKKNLNFNYRILFLPDHIADYIVVHELCHLDQTNHGATFWERVKQTIPDYRARQEELRKGHFS